MRRVILAVSACAIASFALTASAQAAGPMSGASLAHRVARTAKSPKPKVYEWCGSESGCGFKFEFFAKTKTIDVDGYEYGKYTKGKKGLLLIEGDEGCDTYLYKVKGTKNYSGEEPAGQAEFCYVQSVSLTYIS
jgi:hypothetical protein